MLLLKPSSGRYRNRKQLMRVRFACYENTLSECDAIKDLVRATIRAHTASHGSSWMTTQPGCDSSKRSGEIVPTESAYNRNNRVGIAIRQMGSINRLVLQMKADWMGITTGCVDNVARTSVM